jgi:transposase
MVREGMRGDDQQQNHIFSYLSSEERVRKDHPLRTIRAMVDEILKQLSPRFDAMYAKVGRPSIPPEQLLRAQLLQSSTRRPVTRKSLGRFRCMWGISSNIL